MKSSRTLSPVKGAKGGTGKVAKRKDIPRKENTDHQTASSSAMQEDEDFYREVQKIHRVPDDQLKLTAAKLGEDQTRILTANDPNIPNNITKYNYKEKSYKQDPESAMDALAIHFQMEGCMLHIDSDDYKTQEQYEIKKKSAVDEAKRDAEKDMEPGEEDIDTSAKNQFNYSERAAQTFNSLLRSRGVATEPPPVVQYTSTVTQWEIYDTYIADFRRQMQEEEAVKSLERRRTAGSGALTDDSTKAAKEDDMVHSQKMSNALGILERMVNQNYQDEIYYDFKIWEDQSDKVNVVGSLLPLWRFTTEKTKRKHVTALCWNPNYHDLFAVGYGSYEFTRQGSGVICCYSLKNTFHPEFMFTTESGVMSLDFHPHHESLLAVGCYDGTVMVFDVRNKVNRPIYSSSIRTGKHTDPVWQVHWQEEELAKELYFFSISTDGQVASWIMSKNELKMEPVTQLKLVASAKDDPDEVNISGLAGGCCFDFNKHNEHLFIVGTEEGKIHKCSKAYSGQYLETYQGHHMAIYALKWNPFHPKIFMSCSADWTVKIWDHEFPSPLLSFDLQNAVGDACWSPYSSSTFAAVTSDSKVYVFDLAQNKHEPLADQRVGKKAKLTHVQFNLTDPILIVGDERGTVHSLKLSPNLRKIDEPRDENGEIKPHDPQEHQLNRLKAILQATDSKSSTSN
jgi:dynein intermediate chain 1